ncbi:hypothetical protein QVD17_28541 [Tagetes erecta]|uniref:Uncharacterized protein n=1 Tax=Tagetes erecta TaxID=13708 RepID=A0AAD8KAL1_TARER|nr:hypothetical protein QVD17_28541 [Tagetes erecta]
MDVVVGFDRERWSTGNSSDDEHVDPNNLEDRDPHVISDSDTDIDDENDGDDENQYNGVNNDDDGNHAEIDDQGDEQDDSDNNDEDNDDDNVGNVGIEQVQIDDDNDDDVEADNVQVEYVNVAENQNEYDNQDDSVAANDDQNIEFPDVDVIEITRQIEVDEAESEAQSDNEVSIQDVQISLPIVLSPNVPDATELIVKESSLEIIKVVGSIQYNSMMMKDKVPFKCKRKYANLKAEHELLKEFQVVERPESSSSDKEYVPEVNVEVSHSERQIFSSVY